MTGIETAIKATIKDKGVSSGTDGDGVLATGNGGRQTLQGL